MKIGLDISQTAYPGTGVARYTVALVQSLLQYDKKNTYIFFFSSLRQKPPKELISIIKSPHKLVTYPYPPTFLSLMWNDLHIMPIEVLTGPLDLFISSDWIQPPVQKAHTMTIVHDLVPLVHPETSTQKTSFQPLGLKIKANIVDTHKKRLSWVQKEVEIIVADSKSTKDDINDNLFIDSEKVHVVYPSIEMPRTDKKRIPGVLKKYNLKRPYILSVGKLEPRKNIKRLIEAFLTSGLYKNYDLAIVGQGGWGSFELELPDTAQDAVKFLGFVPDGDLFHLYAGAVIFAFPSIYEGFGYPVIEAMYAGCPVATSNTSSLGELGKGYAELFNPNETQDIARALQNLIDKPALRKRRAQRAQAYAQAFTRKRFAHDIMSLYPKV